MATYSGKSVGVAYFLLLFSFIGVCGLQQFYLGRWVRGLLYLFTIGFLGIGVIWDIFTLPSQVRNS